MNVRDVNLSGRMPALDGIRGLAILAVLIFHTTILRPTAAIDRWYHQFGASLWIGVDLFFVLSGFLITGILYDAKGTGHFFRNFYARRVLRIFPLYYLVIGIALFVLPSVSSRFPRLGAEQWWYWTYLSNYHLAEEGLSHLVLGPTWSLAIEEQFYMVWPILVFLLSRKMLMASCVLITLAAMALRVWLWTLDSHHTEIYTSTYTRMDALAVGSFLALAARGEKGFRALFPWIWIPFLIFGAGALYFLLTGHFNRKHSEMILFGYSIVAFFFGSALILALNVAETGWIYRVLTCSVLLFFGKYSYAIYLFNRPFVNVVSDNLFNPNHVPRFYGSSIPGQLLYAVVVIAIPTVLAVVSWHTFEKHFLRLKEFFGGGPQKQSLGNGRGVPVPQNAEEGSHERERKSG